MPWTLSSTKCIYSHTPADVLSPRRVTRSLEPQLKNLWGNYRPFLLLSLLTCITETPTSEQKRTISVIESQKLLLGSPFPH